MIPHAPRFGLLATLTAALLITAGALLPSAAASEPAPDISYVTVVVENDHTDPEDVVMDLKVTWEDAEGCEKDYNGYLLGWEQNIHIGAASAEERKITHSAAHDDLESGLGYAVKIYCGDQASMNLVSAVVIPETFIEGTPVPGTYSSRPALTQLSVSAGGLTPGFHRNRFDYQAPQAAEGVQRATIKTTIEEGASIVFIDGKTGPMGGMGQCNGYRCVFKYGDESGNSLEELEDADPEAPGFQVDLKHGAAYVAMHVHPPIQFGRIYQLTIGDPTAGALSNSPATGAPTISGTAEVGETLTADTSGIADTDGLDNVSFSYQWLSSRDTAISGATGSTYTLVSTDLGKIIKVKVTFTDDEGNEESLTSAATAAVADGSNNPATGAPTISGTMQVGQTLTASTSGIADDDGLTNVSYTYQWIANDGTSDSDIQDATLSTYTLVSDDVGKTIKVKVSFTDDAENAETLTSAETDSVAAAPASNSPATGAPTITGTAQVGETLTASTTGISDTDGLTNVSYAYQWLTSRDAEIDGATSSTYTLVDSDEGKTIKVRLSFTDDAGNSEELTSAATGTVAAAPLTATVHDEPASHDGQSVFTFELRFSESPKDDFSYKTLRDHAFVVTGGEVTKARRLTKGSNIGWEITVTPDSDANVSVVLPVTTDCNADGAICTGDGRMLSEEMALTVSGPAAAASNSPATGAPTITGTAQVGETLTASTTGISDTDGLTNVSYAYQWLTSRDAEIDGATSSTYTLVDSDEGKTIKVRLSFTDDAGNSEELTSAATDSVVAPRPPLTAIFQSKPSSHDGQTTFTFELHFSEEFGLSYLTLRDQAFTVTGGTVAKARRLTPGSNIGWEITITPNADAGVTVVLPVTTDCNADGAVCTADGRKLSNRNDFTVSGPTQ